MYPHKKVKILNLGEVDYKKTWDLQELLNKRIVDSKVLSRRKNELKPTFRYHYLIFCQHQLVFTLGKSGNQNNLLLNQNELKNQQISFYKINRGGDITHHGPGQLVMYPIFDLECFFTDINLYLRTLEEAVIITLAEFGITAGRLEGYTGVWIEPDSLFNARKICAMGIRTSRWVTMHGIALNVNNNLSYFNKIVPCGIKDKAVTSIAKELGQPINIDEVTAKLTKNMQQLFKF